MNDIPTPHRDCDGQVLYIGDLVAVQSIYYKRLHINRVVGFTPHRIRLYSLRNGRLVDPLRVAKIYNQEWCEE